jgi:hypothetical protein
MRSCGPCTACCHVLGVGALEKPSWESCRHEANGCAIYDERPGGCKSYRCAWLKGDLDDGDRPDLVGLIVDTGLTKSFLPIWGANALNVREVSPGASDTDKGAALIDRLVGEDRPVFLKLHGGGFELRSNNQNTKARLAQIESLVGDRRQI